MLRRVLLRVLVATATVAMLTRLTAAASDRGIGGPAAPADSGQHQPERLLVKFKPGVTAADREAVHRKHGGHVVDEVDGIGVQVVQVPRPQGHAEDASHELRKAREYRGEPQVAFAEPDGSVTALFAPNDPRFGQQWSLPKIQAPQAWDVSTGAGVKVAVLDTGVDQNHEDVAVIVNRNFTTSKTVDDKYGHGTHVAGTVAARTNNSKGVAGVAPDALLMNVKVLKDDGSGWWSWVSKGITWAADNGARVISMSLGADVPSSTLEQAVNYAWSKGAVIVAAAGNQSANEVLYPALYTNVIAVASTNANDQKSDFSNYGAGIDIAAPGGQWDVDNNYYNDPYYDWLDPTVGILSTTPTHPYYYSTHYGDTLYYGSLAGTSMATPHVSGVAALVMAHCPSWTNTQVRQKIEASTDPLTDPLLPPGIGRLNAYKAVLGSC